MFKAKIKKWAKKIVTVSLLSLVLSLGVSVSTTYAADCPQLDPGQSTCTKAANTECPDGFTGTKAATSCTKAVKSQESNDDAISQANFLAGLQKALNRLIWPILVLIGGLMDNDLLFGNGMEQKLQDIWIPIRNLVNILFVIVLVGIALYNVLGIGDESGNYSIKSALPKIIIALIAVNFSFLAIKVFLDAINVLTASVFNLPGQVSEGLATVVKADDPANKRDQELIARLCASLKDLTVQQMSTKSDDVLSQETANAIARSIAVDAQFGLGAENISKMSVDEIKAKIQEVNSDQGAAKVELFQKKYDNAEEGRICEGSKLSDQGKAFLNRWSSRNAAFAMALTMGKIVYYQDVHFESLEDVQKLAINTLFSFFMYLIFTISFLALFVVLLARLVVMWLSIALSPVLILILAAPTLKEKLGGFNKIAENFVKLAIAPLIIALSMTIGWIMLNAIRGLDGFSKTSALGVDPNQGIPIVGLSTIQDLTVAVGTIAIIWLGVFGAAEGTIAEKATGFMKEQFERFGTYVGTMPFKHIPFIPISLPGGSSKKYSAGEALYALERSFQKEPTRLWEDLSGQKAITAETVTDKSRVQDEKGIAQWIQSSKNNLKNNDYINELDYIAKNGKTRTGGVPVEDPVMLKAIRDYVASEKTDADVTKLINATKDKSGGTGLPAVATEKPKTGAGAAAPAAAVPEIGSDGKITKPDGSRVAATFGGQNIQTIYGTALSTEGAAQIGIFNNHLRTLAAAKSREDVVKAAEDLRLNPTGKSSVAPTKEELKVLLGDKKYEEVVKTAGGEAALEAALKQAPAPAAGAPAQSGSPAPAPDEELPPSARPSDDEAEGGRI